MAQGIIRRRPGAAGLPAGVEGETSIRTDCRPRTPVQRARLDRGRPHPGRAPTRPRRGLTVVDTEARGRPTGDSGAPRTCWPPPGTPGRRRRPSHQLRDGVPGAVPRRRDHTRRAMAGRSGVGAEAAWIPRGAPVGTGEAPDGGSGPACPQRLAAVVGGPGSPIGSPRPRRPELPCNEPCGPHRRPGLSRQCRRRDTRTGATCRPSPRHPYRYGRAVESGGESPPSRGHPCAAPSARVARPPVWRSTPRFLLERLGRPRHLGQPAGGRGPSTGERPLARGP